MGAIKIILADDHAVVREGYRSLLQKQPGMEIVAEAADGEEAYLRCQESRADVIIIDISMPGQGGLEAIARISRRLPGIAILVFTMHENAAIAVQAFRAGARGYVTKSSPPHVLIRAVHEVAEGRQALSPDIAHALALGRLGGQHDGLGSLTAREFDILRMLCEARSTEDIGRALHISPKTVSNCHYQIKQKLGVDSDIALVHLALRLKIVDLLDIEIRS